ncbi:trigger factor [Spiroplasma endosymbiont of Anurida maritima]|uniref:trigger factor n=1 Tax=Spiroplasma endosymbiont of Anurida maritima TaxID=2967972 RepID=UPI0036D257E5
MKFNASKLENKGIGTWEVKISGDEWKEIIKKAESKAKSEIEVPGFRKGKLPENLVKKHLTESRILDSAHRLAVNKAYQFALDQKSDVQPFSTPDLSVKMLSITEYILEIKFDIKPEVNIKKYKGFTNVKKVKPVLDKKHVEEHLLQIREKFAIFKNKDGAIAAGDSVKFDFEGYMDGKKFDGGAGKDFVLEIGSGQFIPGFEEQMIGMKKGDKKEIEVTFPSTYQVEKLANKPATFKLNIKEVQVKELPELNDDLAKDVNLQGIDTLDKLVKYTEDSVMKEIISNSKNDFIGEIFRTIAKDSNIVIPESIIKKEAQKLYKEFEEKVKQQNIDLKTYKKRTGLTDEQISSELFNDAKVRLENGLIVEHVNNNETFEITDKDIEQEFDNLGKQYGIEGSKLKELNLISESQIKDQVKQTKLFDFLYENNG